ncbi:unnamed protein product [Ilex paraguariensis]|uniref:Uncharacterized protein n=1 Tax=Ilex paraguariensis TaxID=185542 RepID=A0ABC8UVZ2_9AQUA
MQNDVSEPQEFSYLCTVKGHLLFRDKIGVRMVELHLDDIVKVDRVDADGKKYDKVSRIEAQSEEDDMYMQLDVNSDLYPMHIGEKYRMVLAQTLNLDGSAVTSYFPEVI